MIMKVALTAVVSFILVLYGQCLKLDILNKEIVFCRYVDKILQIGITYSNTEEQLEITKLCLTVNGKDCKCYTKFMTEDIFLPKECTIDESHWFAVTITTQHIAAVSYPILVPSRVKISALDSLDTSGGRKEECQYSGNDSTASDSLISLVLPVTLNDLSRCTVLFHSLQLVPKEVVLELLVFVPDQEYEKIQPTLQKFFGNLSFNVTIIAESEIFQRKISPSSYPYAIQMAIKLLAAKLVKTHYYMTLDADVILLQPFNSDQILVSNHDFQQNLKSDVNYTQSVKNETNFSFGGRRRAVYEHEGRFLHHPHWWVGSEKLLNIISVNPQQQGFGVTPSILSTFGSLLTVAKIEDSTLAHLKQKNCIISDSGSCVGIPVSNQFTTKDTATDKGQSHDGITDRLSSNEGSSPSIEAEAAWLYGFGRDGVLWSEYTLYRIVLDYFQLFDDLHSRQEEHEKGELEEQEGLMNHQNNNKQESKSNLMQNQHSKMPVRLHCYDVWFASQLPWKAEKIRMAGSNCLFSVVQSSTGVDPIVLLSLWNDNFHPNATTNDSEKKNDSEKLGVGS